MTLKVDFCLAFTHENIHIHIHLHARMIYQNKHACTQNAQRDKTSVAFKG